MKHNRYTITFWIGWGIFLLFTIIMVIDIAQHPTVLIASPIWAIPFSLSGIFASVYTVVIVIYNRKNKVLPSFFKFEEELLEILSICIVTFLLSLVVLGHIRW